MPKIKFPKTDTILSLSAIFVSICALIISVYEFRVMKVQQQAAVWVYVDIGFSYNSKGIEVYAVNNGVGPTIIKSMQVSYKNKYFENWQEIFDYFLKKGHSLNYSIYKVNEVNEQVLPPKKKVTLLFLPWNKDTKAIQKHLFKLKLKIQYANILEECWQVNFSSQGKERKKLNNCKVHSKKEAKEFH